MGPRFQGSGPVLRLENLGSVLLEELENIGTELGSAMVPEVDTSCHIKPFIMNSFLTGVKKNESTKNLTQLWRENGLSKEAVLLTVCHTHEYNKR